MIYFLYMSSNKILYREGILQYRLNGKKPYYLVRIPPEKCSHDGRPLDKEWILEVHKVAGETPGTTIVKCLEGMRLRWVETEQLIAILSWNLN